MLRSLSDVVWPIGVPEFLQAFHDKRRFHIRTEDPLRAESLLPWQEIEALISMRRFGELEAIQNGMHLPPQLYSDGDMSAFHDLLAQGASIRLKNIQRDVPPIQWLATTIERQMGFDVAVNAYLSFSNGGAFKPHWDLHDVLVVQVHGKKTWSVWEVQLKNPVEKSGHAKHDITDAPSEQLELSPGDALYIPRGEPHAASVSSGDSVHLTFSLNPLHGLDMVQQLAKAAGQDEFLRGDLPPQEAPARLSDYEAQLKTRLHRLVDALDIRALLQENDRSRAPVRQATFSSSEEPTDILRLTLRRRVVLPEGASGEGQTVTIGGAVYSLSPACIDILRRLFESDSQSRRALIEGLSGRHDSSAVTAGVRELSRLGFVMTDRAV